jgi:hypothetical protein
MKSRSRPLLVVLLLALTVAAMLLLVFRQGVREILVIPVLYATWVGGLIFKSLHQGVFWGLMLLVVGVLFAANLRRRPGERAQTGRVVAPSRKSQRVAYWARQIQNNREEAFRKPNALNGLGRLIVSVWAFRANQSPLEIEQALEDGRLELPPELACFFEQEGGRRQAPERDGPAWGRRTWRRVSALLRRGDPPPPTPFEQQVDAMIQSLEDQLEGRGEHHEHQGSRTR